MLLAPLPLLLILGPGLMQEGSAGATRTWKSSSGLTAPT